MYPKVLFSLLSCFVSTLAMQQEPPCRPVPYAVTDEIAVPGKPGSLKLEPENFFALVAETPLFHPWPTEFIIYHRLSIGNSPVYELIRADGEPMAQDTALGIVFALLIAPDPSGNIHWLNRAAPEASGMVDLVQHPGKDSPRTHVATKKQVSAFNEYLRAIRSQWPGNHSRRDIAVVWTALLYHYRTNGFPCIVATSEDLANAEIVSGLPEEVTTLLRASQPADTIRVVAFANQLKKLEVVDVLFCKGSNNVKAASFRYQPAPNPMTVGGAGQVLQ